MKRLVILFISFLFSVISYAQNDIKTDSLKVQGNCNMCKKRIEEAAFVKGVKRADWNKETGQLTIIYKPSKTNLETVAQSVAKAGHSSDKAVATEKDYNRLPECCHYKTNTCEH